MNKPRVLIVDDEPVICDLISEDLNDLGYFCEVASDGNSALRKMEKDIFDIALLDIRLPEISGIDVLKEIKSKYDSSIIIIMITAIDDVNTAVESMKLGALDYIVKPFSLDMLNSRISAALEKKKEPFPKTNINKRTGISYKEKELNELDAIASGIEVKLDLTDKRSTIVTSRTIEVAQEIGIPEERIIQWIAKRAETNKENLKLLKKFSQSAIAQAKMGMAPEYRFEDSSGKSEN
ncbi:MAG: response regulator [Dehalococcoidales bacterium]|nr:response regulator [Dehalococcoidales bacterium]